MVAWSRLLNQERRRPSMAGPNTRKIGRTEFERDYDRILFSTPVRRMADKTQVFPLEEHDAVHTRLTHSHEVSVLARSMGIDIAGRFRKRLGIPPSRDLLRNVSSLMAAVGLVHDIGNPPFGHQGEAAIQTWFRENEPKVFNRGTGVDGVLRQDFLKFEGNAQTFRLVTLLQFQGDDTGLNLTYGTLAALLKYTVSADKARRSARLAGAHKPGYFASELPLVRKVWKKTGLAPGQRHPLTYLIEACDDIAYGVIDVEDTVKKDLASYADIVAHLSETYPRDYLIRRALAYSRKQRARIKNSLGGAALSPKELDDLSMQTFRVAAISAMVNAALVAFVTNFHSISKNIFKGDLLTAGPAVHLRDGLKELRENITFPHRSVLEIELRGSIVISGLMDRLWAAITRREDPADPASKRIDRRSAYTYSRISENYRRVFENPTTALPMRYREAQLLTDMIAGMTDSFALALLKDLRRFDED